MESVKKIVDLLSLKQYEKFDMWLYNAKDRELESVLDIISSQDYFKGFDSKILKNYRDFIRLLLKGNLIKPPNLENEPDLKNLKNIAISCNLFKSSLSQIIKRITYSHTFNLILLILIKSPVELKKIKSKPAKFSRKLLRIDSILREKQKSLKKSILFSLPFKRKAIKLKKKQKTLQEIKLFSENCVWIMIKKGKIINEQLGLWKWKASQPQLKEKIEEFFKSFWTKQSRITNLMRMIVINCNTRILQLLKQKFHHWQDIKNEFKLIDFRDMQFEISLDNLESLLTFKLFSQLNSFFQILKTRSFKMRSKQAKLSHKKSIFFNLSQILYKPLRSIVKLLKTSLKPAKIIEVVQFRSVQKPIIYPIRSQKTTQIHRSAIRSLNLIIRRKIYHYYMIWLNDVRTYIDPTISSTETTMDLSNFILPTDKCNKLRTIHTHLMNIITYKRNSKFLVLNRWIHQAQKRSLTCLNLQLILQKQSMKKKAKKKVFTELVLAVQYPNNFTDID